MPLQSGSSKSVISNNIKEMKEHGHSQEQSVAAALENARRHPKAEKSEVSAELSKSMRDLVKAGWTPGAAAQEARKRHGIDAGAKHKHFLKPMHKMGGDLAPNPMAGANVLAPAGVQQAG